MDKFWVAIEAQLTELKDARTADDVLRILSKERVPYGGGVFSGEGFFAGSGGDGTVLGALMTAGWVVKWMEAPYYYVLSAPENGDEITYCEGDVDRGDLTVPLVGATPEPPADSAERSVPTQSWEVEFSDRTKEVTRQVALWIANDGDHYENARRMIHEGGTGCMADYLLGVLRRSPEWSVPWYVAQDLAPNDLARRIDWDAVAEQLSD